jgi:hypothetical protein
MHFATLPRGAEPFLPDSGLDPGVGIQDAERRSSHPPGFELPEKEPLIFIRYSIFLMLSST